MISDEAAHIRLMNPDDVALIAQVVQFHETSQECRNPGMVHCERTPQTTPTLRQATERHLDHDPEPAVPVVEHVFARGEVASRPWRHQERLVFIGIVSDSEVDFQAAKAHRPFQNAGRSSQYAPYTLEDIKQSFSHRRLILSASESCVLPVALNDAPMNLPEALTLACTT